MNEQEKKLEILNNIFGHKNFRSFQEDVIDAIYEKKDVLTILPTGGGKSLCYQLPTFLMSGITIVISPLIALMQDQIKALKELDIKAEMLNSLQSDIQNQDVLNKVLEGELKFLYVAPERFTSFSFIEVLHKIDINYFVIDEAHCVSAWGHEFRAEYRNLNKLKQNFPNIAIAAFTATATKKVQEDISASLLLKTPQEFRSKTVRDNLIIKSEARVSNGKKQILNFLKTYKGQCGIIYTFTRKETESISSFLREKGYKAKAYHAGLKAEVKNEVFHDFVYENIDIVVATIAFGMGIDKSNIRFVIHTSMPKTIENYYQEIGRAGRDGENSYVYLLYSKADEVKRMIQIQDGIDTLYKETAINKLQLMYRYCISNRCRHTLIASYFDDVIDACKTICDNCTKGEVLQVDISIEAQKFLSAVYRSNQRFGTNHIIDILRASKNQKVLELGHDKLSVYGLGKEFSKNEWIAISDKLIDLEALVLGEFRVLKLNNLGMEILKAKEKVFIDEDKLGKVNKELEIEVELSFDEKLFESFRSLRREIANNHDIPAYVVFGDKTLKELSLKLPLTKEDFLDINGVGEAKYEKYGEQFLNLCIKISDEHKDELETRVVLKKLTKTYLDTLELLEDDKSIEEVAMQRDLSISSVLSHVKLLVSHNKISNEKKKFLLEPLKIPSEIDKWIKEGLKISNIKDLKQALYLHEYLKDINE